MIISTGARAFFAPVEIAPTLLGRAARGPVIMTLKDGNRALLSDNGPARGSERSTSCLSRLDPQETLHASPDIEQFDSANSPDSDQTNQYYLL